MKIGLFGATGNTGQAVLSLAVNAGHEVTVLVRNSQKLPAEIRAQLAGIVEGDVLNEEVVHQVVTGQDGIIVALGTGTDLSPTTVLSEGLKNVLSAMNKTGVKRISACLSGFLFFDKEKLPPRFHDLTDEHGRMLDALKACDRQRINWVAVCPPHIADDPATGKYEVLVGKTPGRRIAKNDLADFLVKCLTNDEYLYQAVGLGYGTEAGNERATHTDH